MHHPLTPMTAADDIPAHFAPRTLFEPIAPWLARFTDAGPPDPARLTTLLAETAPEARSGSGAALRFVPPPDGLCNYEAHIHATGDIPTRSDNWHDFFNALAWCAWPISKTCFNALHLAEIRARHEAGLTGRGPVRDALTQFDECGIVVVSSDPKIPALLAAHEWAAAFWHRRAHLLASTRFLMFGHGTWDQLRTPFFGLCAKALYRVVPATWLQLDTAAQLADTDRWLAQHLSQRRPSLSTRAFSPLPLLGIPGVTADNTVAAYYDDTRQFRPARSSQASV